MAENLLTRCLATITHLFTLEQSYVI